METILLKSTMSCKKNKKVFQRYRLYQILGKKLIQITSESNLPDIVRELRRQDNPKVFLNLDDLECNLTSKFPLKELTSGELYRFFKYLNEI